MEYHPPSNIQGRKNRIVSIIHLGGGGGVWYAGMDANERNSYQFNTFMGLSKQSSRD